MRTIIKAAVLLVLVLIALLLVWPVDYSYREEQVSFQHGGNHLAGVMMIPENSEGPFPVVVFVHGDSALPFDAYGYYRPLWDRLAKAGIASFSWDKAGVGKSTGDWESQNMDDRSEEVIAAIEILKQRADIASDKIGLIGFSQAGWVLPLIAKKSNYPDFMILVSGAINWMEQGTYLMQTRMIREGFSQTQIDQEINNHFQSSEELLSPSSTYDGYLQSHRSSAAVFEKRRKPMSRQRFQFAKLNWRSDARDSLGDILCPTLAVFGDQDLNVNSPESARVYEEEFTASGNTDWRIKIFPGAQHSLLKEKYFKETNPGIWFMVKFEILGDAAFADGFLDLVVSWIEDRVSS
jgi:dienelactone hydrolase